MRGPLSMAVRSTAVRDSISECEAIVKESKSTQACTHDCVQTSAHSTVYWLQGVTILWMIAECGVSLYAAWSARSVAMLAFGGDSLVELLSASVVLFSFLPESSLSKERAARWAGLLLFTLAVAVVIMSIAALVTGTAPETSCSGIVITGAALLVMPVLAWLKRRTARSTDSRALAADSVQSATCAYLAAITLVGLGVNAIFHVSWVDALAALVALPLLVIEGRRAMQGELCDC